MFSIFNIAGDGMYAQNLRLESTARNMAHMDHLAGSPEDTYQPQIAVFEESLKNSYVAESTADPQKFYQPDHPLANQDGHVFGPNMNRVEMMMEMMMASRSYQSNVEILNTGQKMILSTLSLAQ
jgi:flagellar basal-body rod protein FlgC